MREREEILDVLKDVILNCSGDRLVFFGFQNSNIILIAITI